LTVREVVRELRIQVRLNRQYAVEAPSAVGKEHALNAVEALTFAIRFIERNKITLATLQEAADRAVKEYRSRVIEVLQKKGRQ
jgi:hypothetical protein